jgi:hypothetical protein
LFTTETPRHGEDEEELATKNTKRHEVRFSHRALRGHREEDEKRPRKKDEVVATKT